MKPDGCEALATDGQQSAANEHRQWLQDHRVDAILARLVGDMLKERPHDVHLFIHRWSEQVDAVVPEHAASALESSAPHTTADHKSSHDGASRGPPATPSGHDGVADTNASAGADEIEVSEGASLGGTSSKGHQSMRPTEEAGGGGSEACEEETYCSDDGTHHNDEFLQGQSDKDSEERPTVDTLRARFPHPLTQGIVPRSYEKIGEGNYGYVLRGATVVRPNNNLNEAGSNDGVEAAGRPHVGDAAASAARGATPNRYAIKVVPIRALWTLDEAHRTQQVSDTAARTMLSATRAESARDAQAASVDDDDAGIAARGAHHVLRLEGSICYDPDTDAVWIPLTWAPVTLETVISKRREYYHTRHCRAPPASEDRAAAAVVVPSAPLRPQLFSVAEMQSVLRQLLRALHFLVSACNLVHLDVKPANILLRGPWWPTSDAVDDDAALGSEATSVASGADDDTSSSDVAEDGGNSQPCILLGDYGLLQQVGDPMLQLGDFLYMPPEVYWAKDGGTTTTDATTTTTRRADNFHTTHDVWGVGCVLLHMLEGEVPFTWEGRMLFDCFEENYVVPMVKHTSQWPPELLHFLLVCFERDYDKRPTPAQLLRHPFLCKDRQA